MQEVGGSIPPGSTSLRWLRQLRLGKPAPLPRGEASEGCRGEARRAKPGFSKTRAGVSSPRLPRSVPVKYVYILESLDSLHFYVGITDDLRARLAKHNAGEVPHTSKYGPWRLKTYVAFSDEKQAVAFEKYLKSASGRSFAKKRL
nr:MULTISPECIES: GIY-YIG nuclease family protein [unclassified Bradyrhizobium]